MSTFLTIKALHEEGVAKKTIARRLGLDVRTVRSWISRIESGESEPKLRRRSGKLDAHVSVVQSMLERGCTAVQIHHHLKGLEDFDASYETVKRLVRRLKPRHPVCYERMAYRPGSEAQIDFGEVDALIIDGRRRRRWLFCMTLCHSRYTYVEEVYDQKVPTFLGAIRRGFEFFGGTPERLKLDNLKSGVLLNHLGERFYQKDFFAFCRHYGVVPDAARPRTPTDKGRVERDIRYVKESHYRGRIAGSPEEEARSLARWRDDVANQRIHGTTKRKPAELFEVERRELHPLPHDPYEIATWGVYHVRKDCHVRIADNFYSAPYTLVGSKVEVRIAEHEITIFAEDAVVARHRRAFGQGESVTDRSHYPPYKRTATQEVHRQRLMRVRQAGPQTARFLSRLREGPLVLRDQLLRMVKLIDTYGVEAVERASKRALHFEACDSAMRLQRILERGLEQRPLPGDRPVQAKGSSFGRPLVEYQRLLDKEARS